MQHNHEEAQWHAEVSEASEASETSEASGTSRPRRPRRPTGTYIRQNTASDNDFEHDRSTVAAFDEI